MKFNCFYVLLRSIESCVRLTPSQILDQPHRLDSRLDVYKTSVIIFIIVSFWFPLLFSYPFTFTFLFAFLFTFLIKFLFKFPFTFLFFNVHSIISLRIFYSRNISYSCYCILLILYSVKRKYSSKDVGELLRIRIKWAPYAVLLLQNIITDVLPRLHLSAILKIWSSLEFKLLVVISLSLSLSLSLTLSLH